MLSLGVFGSYFVLLKFTQLMDGREERRGGVVGLFELFWQLPNGGGSVLWVGIVFVFWLVWVLPPLP